jgi:hypothetical protein
MAGIPIVQARANCPPSTEITAPVTNPASSEHSHAAVAATSTGSPIRCIGIAWAIGARCSFGSAPMRSFGVTIDDPQQAVLESEPYRRLAYTCHSFTHEFAERLELTDDARELSPRSSARRSPSRSSRSATS